MLRMASYMCLLRMTLYFTLIWTVNGDCSGSVSDLTASFTSSANITSPNYPGAYPSSSNCRWRIEAADADERVLLYFEEFQTEPTYDFLSIFDGDSESATLLLDASSRYTGSWMVSSNQFMYLLFSSDYSVEMTGFLIKYVSAPSDVRTTSGVCPGPITAAIGTPDQISMIDSNFLCGYQISAPSASSRVQFSMLMGNHGGMQVYDGSSAVGTDTIVDYVTSFSDTNVYQSSGPDVFIVKPPGGKFVMYYQGVASSATAPATAAPPPTTVPPEDSCSDGQLIATDTYGLILSPNYPSFYPNNLECSLTINTVDSAASIRVDIIDVDILCCGDYVEIFDGPDSSYSSFGRFFVVGENITTTGSSLYLVFHSDSSGSLRGFEFQYIQVTREIPSCAPASYSVINAGSTESFINSPNYPDAYHDNTVEYWLIIKPSENDNIVLEMRDIEIEHSSSCSFDNITIYDGACNDSPVLDVICGTDDQTIEDDSGLYVLVEFRTDGTVTYKGFEMAVYIGDEKEPDGPSPLLFIIPIVIVGVIIIIIICCVAYHCTKRQKRAKEVSPVVTSLTPVSKPPPLQKRTTQQLLHELQARYGSRELDKGPKPKRKTKNRMADYTFHPEPGPSGFSNASYSHPFPDYGTPPPPYHDPVYPPNFFETSAHDAQLVPSPVKAPISQLPPTSAPPPSLFNTKISTAIPPAFSYMTPSDARKAGLYG